MLLLTMTTISVSSAQDGSALLQIPVRIDTSTLESSTELGEEYIPLNPLLMDDLIDNLQGELEEPAELSLSAEEAEEMLAFLEENQAVLEALQAGFIEFIVPENIDTNNLSIHVSLMEVWYERFIRILLQELEQCSSGSVLGFWDGEHWHGGPTGFDNFLYYYNVTNTLTEYGYWGDIDQDGIPNGQDQDADNDGVDWLNDTDDSDPLIQCFPPIVIDYLDEFTASAAAFLSGHEPFSMVTLSTFATEQGVSSWELTCDTVSW